MNRKILSIIFSLFLVGVFSISCSNSDKTGSSTIDDSKGIEQFNGNSYVSTETFDASNAGFDANSYVWVSVKDGKLAIRPDANNATAPSSFDGFYIPSVNGSGADYTFDSGDGYVLGTLKFTDTSVTINFKENLLAPSTIGKDIVCNKK